MSSVDDSARILATMFLAAYEARAGSYDPEQEHHVLSFSGAAKAAGASPILCPPVVAMLASEDGEVLRNWALRLLQATK